MNSRERLDMVMNAGITPEDIEGYMYFICGPTKEKEYTLEDTQELIDKIITWKKNR